MVLIILWTRMYESAWDGHKHKSDEYDLECIAFGYLFQDIGITSPWWKMVLWVDNLISDMFR
jgi:hypothetical protein